MARDNDGVDDTPDRDDLLKRLQGLTKRQQEEEAAKKRDAKIHNEELKSIKDEIKDVMDQLEQLDGDTA
jgi:hypothetical protein